MTFVNDLELGDGSSSLKDVSLLYELFQSEEAVEKHIIDILNLTIQEGFHGIEIDYEAIKGDIKLWELYIGFIEDLYAITEERNIPMRVVLEPNVPLDNISFPLGPDYVIMCYNLHGHGTSSGPKADKEFIIDMVNKFKSLPGEINFAFASGGFDFSQDGGVKSLTQKEAENLKIKHDAVEIRDEESRALYFNYKNNGIEHEVWYADSQTIRYWIQLVKAIDNYSISIWKAGGNVEIGKVSQNL